jgi:ABC-type protease/lipase transport system fused ATPase/permease subunit
VELSFWKKSLGFVSKAFLCSSMLGFGFLLAVHGELRAGVLILGVIVLAGMFGVGLYLDSKQKVRFQMF